MTFHSVFTAAPLGAMIAFNDGTPRPPERFKRKLSTWQQSNGRGILTECEAADGVHAWSRDTIRLQTASYRSDGVPFLIVTVGFCDRPGLDFTIEKPLQEGAAVILNVWRGKREVAKVCASLADAMHYRRNGYASDMYAVAIAGPDGTLGDLISEASAA